MAEPRRSPTSGDVLLELIVSATMIGGLGFSLGFRLVAEDRSPAAVLSMSGLSSASAMIILLFAEIPCHQRVEKEANEAGNKQGLWDEWFNVGAGVDCTKEDIGTAMLFVQSKALCIYMPISFAATIYRSLQLQPNVPSGKAPDADAPS